MREASLEAYFRRAVQAAGGFTVKLAPVTAGTPDRLVILPGGRVHIVELKTSTGELRPIQRAWIARAAERGYAVPVLYGRDEIDAWLADVS